ncbi:MAG: hypothetical protein ACREVR_03865 [Burkholderiales bacterium]
MKEIPQVTKYLAYALAAVLVAALMYALLGCSPGPRVTGDPKRDRDAAECYYEAEKAAAPMRDYERPGARADFEIQCMRLRGWK